MAERTDQIDRDIVIGVTNIAEYYFEQSQKKDEEIKELKARLSAYEENGYHSGTVSVSTVVPTLAPTLTNNQNLTHHHHLSNQHLQPQQQQQAIVTTVPNQHHPYHHPLQQQQQQQPGIATFGPQPTQSYAWPAYDGQVTYYDNHGPPMFGNNQPHP